MNNSRLAPDLQYLIHCQEASQLVLLLIRVKQLVKVIENVITVLIVLDQVSVELAGGLLLHSGVLRFQFFEDSFELYIFIAAS